MGYGIAYPKYKLFDAPFCGLIKEALYEQLTKLTGYRRARFCSEATDTFQSFTPDELSWNGGVDMIYAIAEFPEPPEDFEVVSFAPGYMRVVADKVD